jgi:hypothetical protein
MTTLASRRSICRLLIGVLVSTQMAIAAYACSGMPRMARLEQDRPVGAAVAMADHGRVGAMASDAGSAAIQGDGMGTGYGGMDPTLPNLCVAHCQYGQQSADHASAPAVPTALLTGLYTLPSLGESSEHAGPLIGPQGSLTAAAPSHAILHCCLRD